MLSIIQYKSQQPRMARSKKFLFMHPQQPMVLVAESEYYKLLTQDFVDKDVLNAVDNQNAGLPHLLGFYVEGILNGEAWDPFAVDFVPAQEAERVILDQDHSQWPRSSVHQRILQAIPDVNYGNMLLPLGPKIDLCGHLYFDFMVFRWDDNNVGEIPLEVVTYLLKEDQHPATMDRLTRTSIRDVVRITHLYHQPNTGLRPSVLFGPSVPTGWIVSVPPTIFNPKWAWCCMDLSGYLGLDQEDRAVTRDGTMRWRLIWDFQTGKAYHITQDPTEIRILYFRRTDD